MTERPRISTRLWMCAALLLGCSHTTQTTRSVDETRTEKRSEALARHPIAAAPDIPGSVTIHEPPSRSECATLEVVFHGNNIHLDSEDQRRLDRIAECIEREPAYHVRMLDTSETIRDITRLRELREERARSIAAYLQDRGVPSSSIDVVAPGTSGAFTEDVAFEMEPPVTGP